MPQTLERIDTTPEERFLTAFRTADGTTLNGGNSRLHALRKEAIERFEALGFPKRKAEAYKYTNIQQVLKRSYTLQLAPREPHVTAEDIAPFLVSDLEAHVLVLVNGRFNEALSSIGELPEGAIVTGFADAARNHPDLVDAHFGQYADHANDAFIALNTAFTQDGAFVYVPKSTVLEKPVHIVSVVSAEDDLMLQPRYLFVAEENAQATIIQTGRAITDTHTFTNAVVESYAGRNAHLDHYEIQDEGPKSVIHLSSQGYQHEQSVVRTNAFTFSGELVRNNLRMLPDGPHCESHLYGLVLGRGDMHVDNHTVVDHAAPDCYSSELYKHLVDEDATAVFNGRVLVRQDSQRINAYQSNDSLLLSEDADIYSKPELEIYADDVECSHGATTGTLDNEAIFYLQSRGLSYSEARALLLVAFARDVLDNVKVEPLEALLDTYVTARFGPQA
jgi:Fe-S cluster assembly protein SufD